MTLRFHLREEGKKKLEEEKKRLKRDKLLLEKAQRELQNAIKGLTRNCFFLVVNVPDPMAIFFLRLQPGFKFALFSFVSIGYRSRWNNYSRICKILAIISNNLVVPDHSNNLNTGNVTKVLERLKNLERKC